MQDVLVLCYHAVSPSWPAELSVTPERFERQLQAVLERGYAGATFTAAVEAPAESRTLVVTFDDGFRSVLERAKPVLDRLGLPATLFVPTDFVGVSGPIAWPGTDHWLDSPHRSELHGLSWDEVRELADSGWEIGSHTCSHPRLPRLDDAALATELGDSRAACERELRRPCPALAYPYGNVDERVIAATAAAGYRTAAALPHFGWHRPHPLRYPRVGVYHNHDEGRFRREVSPWVRRLRASPAWPIISRTARAAARLTRR